MTPTNTPLPDLSGLKKIAEAALTFGGAPWAYAAHGRDGGYGVGVCFDEHTGKNLSGEISDEDFQVSEPVAADVENSVYARFIATFDPPTVLALIAKVEALEGREEGSAVSAAERSFVRHLIREMRAAIAANPEAPTVTTGDLDPDILERVLNVALAARAEGRPSPELAFLLDRLADFEAGGLESDASREWHGHVAPAIARLRSALSTPSPEPDDLPDTNDGEDYARRGLLPGEQRPSPPAPEPGYEAEPVAIDPRTDPLAYMIFRTLDVMGVVRLSAKQAMWVASEVRRYASPVPVAISREDLEKVRSLLADVRLGTTRNRFNEPAHYVEGLDEVREALDAILQRLSNQQGGE